MLKTISLLVLFVGLTSIYASTASVQSQKISPLPQPQQVQSSPNENSEPRQVELTNEMVLASIPSTPTSLTVPEPSSLPKFPEVAQSTPSATPVETPQPKTFSEVIQEVKPTPKATITPLPKVVPSDDPTPIPVPTPTTFVAPPSPPPGGLNADKLFDIVNNYRISINLPPFEKDSRSCNLAASRAPEIDHEIAIGHMHIGLRNRNLNYWNSENIISMNSEQAAFNWWINDKVHRDAIQGNYKYSCVACYKNACAQEFTNFQPK